MKHKPITSAKIAVLTGLLSLGLLGCPVQPAPCVPDANASNCGVTGSFATTTTTQIVPKATVDAFTATDMNVNSEPADKPFAAGQFVVSDAGDGLVRQISSVTTQSSMVGSRLIKKVYIQTTDASLEDVISSGDAGIEYGDLDFNKATVVSAMPGVQTRAINGTIPFNGIKIPLGTASSLTVGGSITQALKPKFDLTFSGGKLQHFQIGLSGSFSATLEGKLVSGEKLTNASKELTIANYKFTRAFLVGVVPVVVVIEPKLILGAGVGTNNALQMTAKISPTVNLNFNIEFTRSATPQWKISPPTGSFSANPSFTVNTPDGGQVKTFAKLALGMKFYGIAGPEMTVKPFTLAKLSASDLSAGLNTGITVDGKVVAGFKVLGQGLEIASDSLSSTDLATNYKCTSTSCSILVSNPVTGPLR